MILNLISLASVKTQLGLSSTTYDSQISAMIPIVSNDIRRMLNCRYDDYVPATITSGSTTITLSTLNPTDIFMPSKGKYNLGQVIYSPVLPADTYLSSYDPSTGTYTISAAATGSGDYIIPSIELSMFPAISKMIWYKISKMNTNSIGAGVSSETYGPVSITYSDKEINKVWDYPQSLISDLGIPYARIG